MRKYKIALCKKGGKSEILWYIRVKDDNEMDDFERSIEKLNEGKTLNGELRLFFSDNVSFNSPTVLEVNRKAVEEFLITQSRLPSGEEIFCLVAG